MALSSPGVEVTVIDESFYTPAEPGTTAAIIVATGQNKSNAAGTGTAVGTTQANAGTVFRITSQRELLDTFGVPFFEKTVSGTPVHGGELNEYGLLSAYSLLGVTNSVFVARADVDLDQLVPSTSEPGAEPDDGAWWVNTATTTFGVQEWNGAPATTTGGQRFSLKTPIVLTDNDSSKISSNVPKGSVGAIGDYAVVFETGTTIKENAKLYYKSAGSGLGAGVDAGTWVLVGSSNWIASHPVVQGSVISSLTAGENFVVNGQVITVPGEETLDSLVSAIGTTITGVFAKNVNGALYLYSDGTGITEDSSSGGLVEIAEGDNPGALDDLGIEVGAYYPPALQQTPHTTVPTWKSTGNTPRPTGSIWIKTTEPNQGARWRISQWNSAIQSWVPFNANLYDSTHSALYYLDRSGGGANLTANTLFVQTNAVVPFGENSDVNTLKGTSQFRIWYRETVGETVARSAVVADDGITSGAVDFTISESLKGELALSSSATISFTAADGVGSGLLNAERLADAVNSAGLINVNARITEDNEVEIFHSLGGDIRLTDGTGTPVADIFTPYNVVTKAGTANFYSLPATSNNDYLISNWKPLITESFEAVDSQPLNEPQDGQLWYNPNFGEVDIMVHNGNTWVGYLNEYANTDPAGPIVSATEPTQQSDGTALVANDLWISTADLENFPTMYRYDSNNAEWVQIDTADQTTEEGVLFADARYGISGATGNTAGSILDLLTSNFVDTDAPDPDLYPTGMLLYNTRRSGGNVKRYANNYIDTGADNARFDGVNSPNGNAYSSGESMSGYDTDRWITASANNEDGSGAFGRNAQRKVVVSALKSTVDTNEQLRDTERRNFNLIACPGYTEVLSNLINLNIDRGLTAFVVGDTPFRIASDATTLTSWGSNANLAFDNGDDGLVSFDEQAAVFYPSGFTTDLSGTNAVVPPSHMILRTMTLSDQVSFPWFAPAGTRRGGITNATSVGFIDSETGEFQTVALNEGQRDTLYDLKINPITFFTGVGLVNFGQKTRASNASALDRINVARLTAYLRSQLNKLAKPYIFEPNDKITRDEIKSAVESLLLELVGLRAIFDFAVVCDESNNTPTRIDRNELYVDIAIEPVKSIEFIYIPLRVQNTGEI